MAYVGLNFLLNTGIRFHNPYKHVFETLGLGEAENGPPKRVKK